MKKIALGGTYTLKNSKSNGLFVLVDDEDYELVCQHKWCMTNGYAQTQVVNEKGVKVTLRMHRLIMNPPKHMVIDHKDHNGLNNQRSNLRICTPSQNIRNRTSSKGAFSQYLGVTIARNKFSAHIRNNITKKSELLGRFPLTVDGEKEAALAYNKRAIELGGEFANLNVLNINDKALELRGKFLSEFKPRSRKGQKQYKKPYIKKPKKEKKIKQKTLEINNKNPTLKEKILTKSIEFKEGFSYRDFNFGWKKKILYRLPGIKNGRQYSLRKIPLIKLSKTGVGYRLIRIQKSLAQVRAMTKKVNWKIDKPCNECL